MGKHFADSLNAGFITKPIDHSQMHRLAEVFIDHCESDVQKFIKISDSKQLIFFHFI